MKPGILFLDDDKNLLASIRRYLKKYTEEWRLYFVSSYSEAVEVLKNEKIDVVFCDINLPVKNGFDVLRYIKNDVVLNTIEIVMITGMDDSELKRRVLDDGASDLLQKPIKSEDLIARIKSTLKVKLYQDELIETNTILKDKLIASQKMEITSVLATGIIHDIRNIINIIHNYPEIIKIKLDKNQIVEDELGKIQFAASRAESILRQILMFSKKTYVVDCFTDINQVVYDVIKLLETSIPMNIIINACLTEGKLIVKSNSMVLSQLIMNLIINAKEAIGKEGGGIDIKTGNEIFNNKLNYFITVTDNGPGIPEEIKNSIFEKNYSTKEGGQNFGFGLPVVKLLVEKINGHIELASVLNKGTTFKILIPAEEVKTNE